MFEHKQETHKQGFNKSIFIHKYALDEKVWAIDNSGQRKAYYVVCPECNGNAKIKQGGAEYCCKRCNGRGKVHEYLPYTVFPEPLVVGEINFTAHIMGMSMNYSLWKEYDHSTIIRYEDEIYKTKEEAEAACEKLNAERMKRK